MADRQPDSVIFYDDSARSRRRGALVSGWPVIAVMAIGAILVFGNLAGLLIGSHMDTFGSSTGDGLAGGQLIWRGVCQVAAVRAPLGGALMVFGRAGRRAR
jgi:hypothetical protein